MELLLYWNEMNVYQFNCNLSYWLRYRFSRSQLTRSKCEWTRFWTIQNVVDETTLSSPSKACDNSIIRRCCAHKTQYGVHQHGGAVNLTITRLMMNWQRKLSWGWKKSSLFFPAGFWVGAKTLLSRFTLGGPRRRNLLYISLCYERVSILGNWNDDGESWFTSVKYCPCYLSQL